MKITLLHNTPLWVAAKGIRKCWASEGNSDTTMTEYKVQEIDNQDNQNYQYLTEYSTGPADKALINKIGNKYKHASTLEHLSYNFDIDGISRACLQELARHRHASLSVKSSRYTLKELREEKCFINESVENLSDVTMCSIDFQRVSKYIVMTSSTDIDVNSTIALELLREALSHNISNDIAKYCMPESYRTSLVWTINARSLQNFLTLRTNKAALKEIRDLANNVYQALPDEHKYLFTHCVYVEDTDG